MPAPATSDDPATTARRLMRSCDRAALATVLEDGDAAGWPFASLVLTACDHDGAPLLLLSRLAVHTRNLTADPRVSLLYDGTAGLESPLTGARVTVIGRTALSSAPGHRARYLARHPDAAGYAGFGDFAFYRVAVERAHLVAGFGRIAWIDGSALLPAAPAALVSAEAEIVDHMNRDHAAAIDVMAAALLERPGGGWRMTGCDAEGCDLRRDGEVARLGFAQPVSGPDEVRAALVRMSRAARKSADNGP